MKNLYILPRISALAFAMLSIAIAKENTLWIYIVAILTILPLVIYIIGAAVSAQKEKKSFLNNLFGYKQNLIDLLIAGLGIGLALVFGINWLAIIWAISLGCIVVDRIVSKN